MRHPRHFHDNVLFTTIVHYYLYDLRESMVSCSVHFFQFGAVFLSGARISRYVYSAFLLFSTHILTYRFQTCSDLHRFPLACYRFCGCEPTGRGITIGNQISPHKLVIMHEDGPTAAASRSFAKGMPAACPVLSNFRA